MKKVMKQMLTLALTAVLAGGAFGISASAQEIEENTSPPAAPVEKIAGTKVTLDSTAASRDMDWDTFAAYGGSTNWISCMGLPDYAVGLYNTLASGGVLIDDSVFSPDTAVTVNYSDGNADAFNGIEVLNVSNVAKMTNDEWESIQDNLSKAYSAFLRDYPGVFWLSESPKINLVSSVQTDSEGTEVCAYRVYFMLKDHGSGKGYDIREKAYRSAEAINAAIAERDAAVQKVLGEADGKDLAGKIVYFNDEADAVAASMGLGRGDAARGFKLLCDSAGISSIITAGSGGNLDAYVYVNDGWFLSDEVRETKEESATGENKANTENSNKEDTKETDKKDDSKEESGEDEEETADKTSDSKEKSSAKASAAPAFRSQVMSTAANEAVGRAAETLVFSIKNGAQDVSGDAAAAAIHDAILTENEARKVFGNTWGNMVSIATQSKIQELITVKYDGKEAKSFSFRVMEDSYKPNAGHQEYTIACSATFEGITNTITNEFKYQVDIEKHPLKVTTSRIEFWRTYGTEIFTAKYLSVDQELGKIVLLSGSDYTPVSGADSRGQIKVVVEPQSPKENQDDDRTGTVEVELRLAGNQESQNNYILLNSLEEKVEVITLTARYDCKAAPIEQASDMTIDIDPDYDLIYTGTPRTPGVTVTVKGKQLKQGEDYTVEYKNNINASTDDQDVSVGNQDEAPYVYIVANQTGQRYTWSAEAAESTFRKRFDIRKREWDKKENQDVQVKYGKEETQDLSSLMPDDGRITSHTVSDSSVITEIGLTSEEGADGNKTIKYKINEDAEPGTNAKITVIVQSQNYKEYWFDINVEVIDKEVQDQFKFKYDIIKLTEGDDPKLIDVLGRVEGSEVIFKSSSNAYVGVDNDGNVAPKQATPAGKPVTITATATETPDYHKAEAKYDVIVVPKENKVTLIENDISLGDKTFRLEIEEGISQIDEGLPSKYSEVSDIEEEMIDQIKEAFKQDDVEVSEENIRVYDISLMVRQSTGDYEWKKAVQAEDFPEGGLPITIPLPVEGMNGSQYNFKAAHMFTKDMNGYKAGDVELMGVTVGSGLQFTVNGLSPIAVGWVDKPAEDPGTDNPGTEDPGTDNPGTEDPGTDDPNNQNNGNNNNNGTNGTDGTDGTNGTNGSNGTNGTNGSGTTGTSATGSLGSALGLTSGSTGTETGDTHRMIVYGVLLVIALELIGIVCFARKKRK